MHFRISQIQGSTNAPGPGEYDAQSQFGGAVKYLTRKVRGKQVRMRSEMPHSAVFKSSTGRTLDQNLLKDSKTVSPAVGYYKVYWSSSGIGASQIQGGAPNNFLLMKNEKRYAPFQSTVSRFKSLDTKISQSLGPGSYVSTQDQSTISKSVERETFYQKNRVTFGNADRFRDETKQKNFRIGPKINGPGPTSYNADGSFNKKTFNLRLLQQQQVQSQSFY